MMREETATKRQKELLSILYQYIKDTGYPPTFEEMRQRLGVASNQSVIDLLNKLKEKKIIQRKESGARNIAILPLGYKVLGKPSLVPFLGVTSAGAPVETLEVTGEWQQVSSEVAQLQGQVFLLKVSGDSMINAGIDDGDVVLVEQRSEFVSGMIVLAYKNGEATIKRFMSEDKPPYVYLKPENPKYENILFTEETELRGRIISVLKSGYWKSIK
jgi:repressor LexA